MVAHWSHRGTCRTSYKLGTIADGIVDVLTRRYPSQPNKVEVLPNGLAGIPDGLDRMEQNKVSATKLIAHPQETA